jgi:transposase
MLFGISSKIQFYLYRQPTDMRKCHNGLCGIIINELNINPVCGDVFIFINRPRTHIKLLFWDRTGFVIYYKRLESGTFELPKNNSEKLIIAQDDLMMILEGISLESAKKRKRYLSRNFVN